MTYGNQNAVSRFVSTGTPQTQHVIGNRQNILTETRIKYTVKMGRTTESIRESSLMDFRTPKESGQVCAHDDVPFRRVVDLHHPHGGVVGQSHVQVVGTDALAPVVGEETPPRLVVFGGEKVRSNNLKYSSYSDKIGTRRKAKKLTFMSMSRTNADTTARRNVQATNE